MTSDLTRQLKESEALALLIDSDVPAKKEAFGFSISHPESEAAGSRFAVCGMDNDYSISLAVETGGEPRIDWFFRWDFLQMAEFVIDAYSESGESPTRAELVEVFRRLDSKYDYDELESKLAPLLNES